MISIGNDILNLSDPENSRTFSSLGIEKFFSDNENCIVENKQTLFAYQKLWTLKESIYKCMLKQGCKTSFSPAMISLDIKIDGNILRSKAKQNQVEYFAYCYIDGDFVVSIAANSENKLNLINSFFVSNKVADVYKYIADEIKSYNGFESGEILKTKKNIPVFIFNDGTEYFDLSLSNEDDCYFVSYLSEKMNVLNCKYI